VAARKQRAPLRHRLQREGHHQPPHRPQREGHLLRRQRPHPRVPRRPLLLPPPQNHHQPLNLPGHLLVRVAGKERRAQELRALVRRRRQRLRRKQRPRPRPLLPLLRPAAQR
jgi:hypothetical protein